MAANISPVQEVLNLTELLESILLFTSPYDVLRCQRVNRKFGDTIARSSLLRRRLFFDPDHTKDSKRVPIVNPLLAENFDSIYRNIAFCHDGIAYTIAAPQKDHATNPMPMIEGKDDGIWHLSLDIQELPTRLSRSKSGEHRARSTSIAALSATLLSWSGSWKSMYLSDPPCNIHLRVWKRSPVWKPDNDGRPSGDYMGRFEISAATLGNVLAQFGQQRQARQSDNSQPVHRRLGRWKRA